MTKPTVSPQKLTAILKKAGFPVAKWSKSRVTWRCSEGFNIWSCRALNEIIVNLWFASDNPAEKVSQALTAAGIKHKIQDHSRIVVPREQTERDEDDEE